MELQNEIIPALEIIRNILMKVAEFISSQAAIEVSNIYFLLVFIVSVWAAKKILEFFYTTLDGRKAYWLILAGIIFWILKYLGAN